MNRSRTVLSHLITPTRLDSLYGSRYISRIKGLNLWITVSLLALVLLTGCQPYKATEPIPDGSYLNRYKDLTTIGRVVIVELDNDSAFPQISADVTEALFLALQKKQIFGLTMVRQDNPTWRSLELKPDAIYSLEELLAIRQTLKCEAVLVGTVTQYEPYPHLAIGLRLKLLDLTDGQLLWALEQVWDSSDKTTQRQIKQYFQSQTITGFESNLEQMTVVSPLKFIRFVAHEIGQTLKPIG
jgi:hypothetical protein